MKTKTNMTRVLDIRRGRFNWLHQDAGDVLLEEADGITVYWPEDNTTEKVKISDVEFI